MKTTIGDQEVYLAPDELPEFEYSLIEVVDPSKVRGSRSTTFDVPGSIEAFQVLGGRALNEEVASEQPFRIGEGSQILFDGVCTPVEWSDSKVTVAAFGDNASWINAAKNTKCNEVDLGVSGPVVEQMMVDSWTDENRADVYPLMDYGSMLNYTSGTDVKIEEVYPAVRMWKLLTAFFLSQGFTVKARGEFTKLWKKLIIPYNGGAMKFRGDYYAPQSFTLATTNAVQAFDQGIYQFLSFDTVVTDPDTQVVNNGGAYYEWEAPVTATWRFRMDGTFRITRASSTTTRFQLILVRQNGMLWEQVAFRSFDIPWDTPFQTQIDLAVREVIFESQLQQQETYRIIASTVSDVFGTDTVTLLPAASLDAELIEWAAWQDLINFDIAGSMDKGLSVGDVISGMANIFRLAIQTDQLSNTVTFSTLDDYLRPIESGLDWSERIDETKDVVKVQPEVPTQYRLHYTEDSKDERAFNYDGAEVWTAEGVFVAGGRDEEKEITVKFAATREDTRFGSLVIPVLKEEDKTTPYLKSKPRMLVFDGLEDGEWSFAGTPRTQYPRAYFRGTQATDVNLGFGDDNGRPGTVARYWRNYLTRSVKPYLKAQVVVYDDEFMDFAFGRPRLVHDGIMRSWVYVQKIKGKRFGDNEPVECELIPL